MYMKSLITDVNIFIQFAILLCQFQLDSYLKKQKYVAICDHLKLF